MISSIELFVRRTILFGRVPTFITLSVIGVEWWRVRNRKKKKKRKKGHVVYLISEVLSKVGCMMMVMVFKSEIIRVWQKDCY